MNNELVSVIICTYKAGNELRRAIDSVINQTYENIEIIVVDDNGKDTDKQLFTKGIIDEYKQYTIKYVVHEKNKNGSVARNSGIKVANGEFISFLDDDDFYLRTRIEQCVSFLKKHEEYKGVYTGVVVLKNEKMYRIIHPLDNVSQSDLLLNFSLLGTGSNMFFKKDCLQEIQKFDEDFVRHQDVEFMVRFLRYFKLGIIDDILVVKATNNVNNIPNYKKAMQTKEMFFDKFKIEIDKLDEKKRIFYAEQYRELMLIAIGQENYEEIKKAKQDFAIYGKLSVTDFFRLLLLRVHLYRRSKIWKVNKIVYLRFKDLILRKKIGKQKMKEINESRLIRQ